MDRRYSELVKFHTFEERLKYLQLDGSVAEVTFGSMRYLNQEFYRSQKWKSVRDKIIIRDNGCDLAMDDYSIISKIIIHHLNPVTEEQIINDDPELYDPENLICVSHDTHNAIHYGYEPKKPLLPLERKPFDTCPWRVPKLGG